MSKLFVAALGAVLLVGVGCQKDRSADAEVSGTTSTTTMRTESTGTSSGTDDCAMCDGVQHARADGTCPQCGMKLNTASR